MAATQNYATAKSIFKADTTFLMNCATPAFMFATELNIKTDTALITVITLFFLNAAHAAFVAVVWFSILIGVELALLAEVFCQFQVAVGAVMLCFTICGEILFMLTSTAPDHFCIMAFRFFIAIAPVFTTIIVALMAAIETFTALYPDIAIAGIIDCSHIFVLLAGCLLQPDGLTKPGYFPQPDCQW